MCAYQLPLSNVWNHWKEWINPGATVRKCMHARMSFEIELMGHK